VLSMIVIFNLFGVQATHVAYGKLHPEHPPAQYF
jgi:hypothetical protein